MQGFHSTICFSTFELQEIAFTTSAALSAKFPQQDSSTVLFVYTAEENTSTKF